MTASHTLGVVDGVGSYLGGTWAPASGDYRGGPVEGLAFVRRAILKPGEPEFTALAMPGVTGSLAVVFVPGYTEARETVGAGWLLRTYRVEVHVYTRSPNRDATRAADDVLVLVDRIAEHLRADPTCGTGGYRQITDDGRWGFVLGEGDVPATSVEFGRPSPVQAYVQQLVVLRATATQFAPAPT